jgi:DNA-binding MarR family transcriptional regulator/N-acetylglutamate synthase-like GNAT family acetyltransferase
MYDMGMEMAAPTVGPAAGPTERRIAAIRRFSRFYTRIIGALQEGLLDSRFSLAEARVLFELVRCPGVTASELGGALSLDPGYLSRILQNFERDGLLIRAPSTRDRRQSLLTLTEAGHHAFAPLDARSREEVGALLAPLAETAQAAVVAAMARIETLLSASPPAAWLLRPHRPGDIGWVIGRHGALYAAEYGFDARFEALVAHVAGDFLARHDPACEHCWIAEHDGLNVGSVFLVRQSDETAKLRLLLVEPSARGRGIGKRLVGECIDFARAAGYRRIALWTNEVLLAARAIYQQAGFRLITSAPHCNFGPPMIGEDWELQLC